MAFLEDEELLKDGEPRAIAAITTAALDVAESVISADQESEDGRSQWLWVTLTDGDVMLACFPQGDTYERIRQQEDF